MVCQLYERINPGNPLKKFCNGGITDEIEAR